MKLQTSTQDFIPKLKSFIKGYINLRESGIPNTKVDLDPLLNDFLTQFEEPAPEAHASVPLPPPWGGKPTLYIAQHVTTKEFVLGTLALSSRGVALNMMDEISGAARPNYEIVALTTK